MARQRKPEGPPPPPPVQKLRVRYAKRGRLRFSSTRDFQRAIERAVRRTAMPIAFSGGFHPHPKISYTNAAPTGTCSEAEYIELSVVQRCDPTSVRDALNEALPAGLDIVDVVQAGPGSLSDRLEASVWEWRCTDADGPELRRATQEFLARDSVEITRTFTSGPRTFDTRAAVLHLELSEASGAVEERDDAGKCAIMTMVVQHTTPAVRPDDILKALTTVVGCELVAPPLVTRLAQGLLADHRQGVTDPLAADRDATGIFSGDAPARTAVMNNDPTSA